MEENVILEKTEKKQKKGNFFIELIKILIISFFLFVIITSFIARKTQVDGTSMVPTLEDGDQVIINVLATKIGTVNRFDIVVFEHGKDHLVKRVIGLPMETIELKADKLYVNGTQVAEPFLDTPYVKNYLSSSQNKQFTSDFKVTLKENEYFVLGDNRPYSKDSRFSDIGNVHKENIIGLGGWIIYPFSHFGAVK